MVTSAMLNTVVPFVVLVSAMLFVLKAIARVLVLLELKEPVLKVPPSERVPAVKVNISLTPVVNAPLVVTVAPGALTVVSPIVSPEVIMVAAAKNVGLKLRNVRLVARIVKLP